MTSKTKFPVNERTIKKLFHQAGIRGAANINALGAGEFNAVYSAEAGGVGYAIKISPPERVPVMAYERGMMESELFWYEKLRGETPIPVPKIYYSDLSRKTIPAGFFIMEKLAGIPLGEVKADKNQTAARLATMAAQMHKVKNDKFGYIQQGLHDNWYTAIREMVRSLIGDGIGQKFGSRNGMMLLAFIDLHKDVLARADCRMVNFDIWPPNIICDEQKKTYSWIDPERCFWGDRIMDFVCLEFMTRLDEKTASLKAYNAVTDEPLLITGDERIRYSVGLGYLALIMEVEKFYRYTPLYFGWWRNKTVTKMLYKEAFRVLGMPSY